MKQNIIRSILAAELVLLVPLIAMLFSEEVNWDAFDFIISAILLAGAGFTCYLVVNGVKNNTRLVIMGIVLTATLLLIWAELAVGLFGSPFAGS